MKENQEKNNLENNLLVFGVLIDNKNRSSKWILKTPKENEIEDDVVFIDPKKHREYINNIMEISSI